MMDMRNNGQGPRGPIGSDSGRVRRGPASRPSMPTGRFSLYGQTYGPRAGENGFGALQYEPEDPLFDAPLGEDEVRDQAVPIADPPAAGTDPDGENTAGTCGGDGVFAAYPLAMVYAPDQAWRELYEDEEALSEGTLFRELNFPFCPGCRRSGR